jgi:hypothetical protein
MSLAPLLLSFLQALTVRLSSQLSSKKATLLAALTRAICAQEWTRNKEVGLIVLQELQGFLAQAQAPSSSLPPRNILEELMADASCPGGP